MDSGARSWRLRRTASAAWSELGRGGRLALVGITVSALVAVTMGFWIPHTVKHHLLASRAEAMRTVSQSIVDEGLLPRTSHEATDLVAFDTAVHDRLLGGETVGAKVFAKSGDLLYSSYGSAAEGTATLPVGLFAGGFDRPVTEIVEADDPGHEGALTEGRIIEIFLPVAGESGDEVVAVVELEQQADGLDETIRNVTRNVWVSIGAGLGFLTIFLIGLMVSNARGAEERQRRTRVLLRQALAAQEAERKRIVGVLHGDVGQRVYRVLYGLEGSQLRVDDQEVHDELGRLVELVRGIDMTLRSDLRMLHRDTISDIGFTRAIEELAETTRLETGLDVRVELELVDDPTETVGGTLFWAVEEAVINARKHAEASLVVISAWREKTQYHVRVEDDGVGIGVAKGIGLTTTEERVNAAGGGMDVTTRRHGGVAVHAWMPEGPDY